MGWMGDYYLHDGVLLHPKRTEWGAVEAIEEYEKNKSARMREEAKKYIDEILTPDGAEYPYSAVMNDKEIFKKMSDNLYKACRELEAENKRLKEEIKMLKADE